MTILTESSDRPELFAELVARDMPHSGTADWWEEAARRAVNFFPDKITYLKWVYSTYGGEENRFAASVCWDIIKLDQSQEGRKT